jgi:hypothetical protein
MKVQTFTEIFNCGKIGKIAIESFLKYHSGINIKVYGCEKDFEWIPESKQITRIILEPNDDIVTGFTQGHLGTARLWAKLIMESGCDYLLHFDSDNVFRGNIVDDIIGYINDGYDLIGGTRNYKNNPQHRDDIRHLDDVVSTNCFAFNINKITKEHLSNYGRLLGMVRGIHNPLRHTVLDFFDPVSFDILNNGGEIKVLPFDHVGACSKSGSRDNKYAKYNNLDCPFKIDFGKKLVHFSAVGSGMNFYNNPSVNVPKCYKNYALDRYALFCKIFYNEDLGMDLSQYKDLLEIKEWF